MSPGQDGFPFEVYLRMTHMLVPILTNVFNYWFAQGTISGSITKGVITTEERWQACSGGTSRLKAHNSAKLMEVPVV